MMRSLALLSQIKKLSLEDLDLSAGGELEEVRQLSCLQSLEVGPSDGCLAASYSSETHRPGVCVCEGGPDEVSISTSQAKISSSGLYYMTDHLACTFQACNHLQQASSSTDPC